MKIKLSESLIQKQVIQYLRLKHFTVVRLNSGLSIFADASGKKSYIKFYSIENYGASGAKYKNSGLPDIIAFKGGLYLLLEIKTDTGKLTISQTVFKQHAEQNELNYFVIRNLDELIELIGE